MDLDEELIRFGPRLGSFVDFDLRKSLAEFIDHDSSHIVQIRWLSRDKHKKFFRKVSIVDEEVLVLFSVLHMGKRSWSTH